MPRRSATSPLLGLAKKHKYLRIASMPEVGRSMEETALSANYQEIAETSARLASLFERSNAVEVTFSTRHTCHFDISENKPVYREDGILYPGTTNDMNCHIPLSPVFSGWAYSQGHPTAHESSRRGGLYMSKLNRKQPNGW